MRASHFALLLVLSATEFSLAIDASTAGTATAGTATAGTATVGTATVGTATVGTATVGTATADTATAGTATVGTATADTATAGTATATQTVDTSAASGSTTDSTTQTTDNATTTTTAATTNAHPNPSVNQICPTNPGMNDRIRTKALDATNYRRSQLALGRVAKNNGRLLRTAMNMRKVRYNCALETAARESVNRCVDTPPSNLPSNVQQNILKFPQSAASNRVNAITYAIRQWWKQVRLVQGIGMKAIYRANHQGTPIMSFIKMAWARTLTIGCAVSGRRICTPNWVAACHYRVNGFAPGNNVYLPGTVCSQCPGRTTCTMPEGLCTL
ncbi:hypothetical protein Q1695_002276 [Nippostrongylus brasiliensis]|nr:hypothetical protein Q1695_002276 [Nippostrongylus brasiliensis]